MNLAISTTDVAILVVFLVGMLSLGLWVGRGTGDLSDYLLGGRRLPWWALLGSIVATETSTVTFLSVPGLAFNPAGGDLRFLQLALGFVIGRFVIVALLLPQFFRGNMFTSYQVLHRRFGGATKRVSSLLFLVTRTLADGLRLYLVAIVLQKVVGMSLECSVALIGVITIVYTVFGGMRSVVWNDCLQFVIYIAGALLAVGVMTGRLSGGWSELASFAQEHGKLRLWDVAFDLTAPYTLWSGLIGGVFLSLATHGTDQLMVQRYLCAKSQREAARALICSGVVVFGQFALFLCVGIALAAFYASFPPDVPFAKTDEVFATFIVHHLPVGIVGIVLASVFSAAMSTLSSSLNSSAAVFVNDLMFRQSEDTSDVPSRRLVSLTRRMTIAFGVCQIAVALAGAYLSKTVVDSVLAIAGFTTGIVLGVFLLGVLTKRVGQVSALLGMLGGLAAMCCIAFLTDIAWPWYTLIGSVTTFGLGMLSHALLGDVSHHPL